MEYAAGGELLHRIRKRLRLPDTEAKFYAAEIADALQYMHNEVRFVSPHERMPNTEPYAFDTLPRWGTGGLPPTTLPLHTQIQPIQPSPNCCM